MSISQRQYSAQRRGESRFYHRLVNIQSLSSEVLDWMKANNKEYSEHTLARSGLQQGILQQFDKSLGSYPFDSRGFVCADPCIVISVVPIYRCYRYLRAKEERWRVVPAGHGAKWFGDLSHPEPIICEGEWDRLRLFDKGFENAITHTAGAGTWLPNWTPLFKDKIVWICYDRDVRGQQGAAKVAEKIFSVARRVRLVDLPLPGTLEANDVSDFFRLGGTADEFRRLLKAARLYAPKFYRPGRRNHLRDRRFNAPGSRLAQR